VSIAAKRGETGQTGLAGGIRVSKSSLRVDAYGTVDELNSVLRIARARCESADLRHRTKLIQRELFRIGSGLATPPESRKLQVPVTEEMVEELTRQVHEIEATEGLLSDWSLPELIESGEAVEPNILAYLNRLSDLLWLFARKIEVDAGIGNSLREMNAKGGPKWSRAW
jgi:cob(I)alamin adenosyltransferase